MSFWKKVLRVVAVVIAVVAIVYLAVAVLALTGVLSGGLITTWLGFGFMSFTAAPFWGAFAVGFIGLTMAYIISPEGARQVVNRVLEALGQASDDVGRAVGDVLGGAMSGLAGSSLVTILLVAGVGYVGYKYLTREQGDSYAAQQ